MQMVREGRTVCSWHKLANCLDIPRPAGGSLPGSSTRKDPDFVGTTFDEAVRMSETGWIEGAEAAEQHPTFVDLFAQAAAPSVRWNYDPTEGEVQWDRLLSGADDFLLLPKTTTGWTKACRVLVPVTCSAFIEERVMLQRAIDIAAGLLQLENARISTELWSVAAQYDCDNRLQYHAFKVHSTGDIFNLPKIAFFCGHSAMLRRLVFALNERATPELQEALGHGYGRVAGLSAKNLAQMALPPWDGDQLVVDTLRSNNIEQNRNEISKSINKVLRNLSQSTQDSDGTAYDCL